MLIELNDLRHAINRALNLGRYQIVVKTAGAEQVPASITLDLLERDDDEYAFPTEEAEPPKRTVEELVVKLSLDASDFEAQIAALTKKATEAAVGVATDEHGPAIPEQAAPGVYQHGKGPLVYEFALQDYWAANEEVVEHLADVRLEDALDFDAAMAADWVHVYDRVTRERRTLKRPEPDAVLKGLRDLSFSLGRPYSPTYAFSYRLESEAERLGNAIMAVKAGESGRIAEPGRWAVYREGEKVVYESFDQTEQPAADSMPPVGPLTSTEGLKAGDVLRVIFAAKYGGMLGFEDGALATFTTPNPPKGLGAMMSDGEEHWWDVDRFAFVARPGVWMPWEGAENPVPGLMVRIRFPDGSEAEDESSSWYWGSGISAITAYMVVDTPPASSDI